MTGTRSCRAPETPGPARAARLLCLLALVVAASLVAAGAAGAWGRKGHAVVALIAEEHLTPKTRAAVEALLATEGNASLVAVASWADVERRDSPTPTPFHSATLPPNHRPYDGSRKMCHKNNCIIAAVQHDIEVLRDPAAAEPDKVIALKYLVHFVGDMHQPMHVTRAGRGQLVILGGETMTLHKVWDKDVVTARGAKVGSIVRRVEKAAKPDGSADIDPVHWAEEGRDITRDRILVGALADPEAVAVLPDDYAIANWPIARDQLMLAGLRLANTLNAIFDPPGGNDG